MKGSSKNGFESGEKTQLVDSAAFSEFIVDKLAIVLIIIKVPQQCYLLRHKHYGGSITSSSIVLPST